MVEGAKGACGVVLTVPLGHMAVLIASVALGEPVGGDNGDDVSGVEEEANRGAYSVDVVGSDSDGDGGSALSLA